MAKLLTLFALHGWMMLASSTLLIGALTFALWGAPRLDANIAERSLPISITHAAYGILVLALVLVLAYVCTTAFPISGPSAIPQGIVTAAVVLSVSVCAPAPWLLLLLNVIRR
ncbi:hypothetical protein [Mycolicibacterium palauense]|uniref:hypothetical protein n=1 Tax=Mycolicibacterium palauense TaxID=2034511 RepID=UPI000BFF09C7|nr:hypothetical protein [Mycolicibacterium palauense]